MDSSAPSTSRFRFREHNPEMADGDSTEGYTSSDSSSVSSDADDESELQSMTGKGIRHLCSELLELRRESEEDFQKNIFSNYSAFIRIFEEIEGVKNEFMQLKHHYLTQRRLVNNLKEGIHLEALWHEIVAPALETIDTEPSSPTILETHVHDISETLDTLLSEHKLDEALAIFEMEAETLQCIQLQEDSSSDVLTSYNSAMSERRVMLADMLTLTAENPRVSAPELQKALVGLCQLGNRHLATQLLLKYYHSRIASGVHNFQLSRSCVNRFYIPEVTKFVFSMISQAKKSFDALYGETSVYASELIQWGNKEAELFAVSFTKYIKSVAEISGQLSTAVEAVEVSLAYCSLLEAQRLVLKPCLMRHFLPCMEEVLQIHIDHLKKVICIFSSTDDWLMSRYLISGILSEGISSAMVMGQLQEYCLLTSSGKKFLTLLQATTEDMSPLIGLQMEGSVLGGLMNVFTEYVAILESALTCDTTITEKVGPNITWAESLAQQVSIISNLSALSVFFSEIVRSIVRDIDHLKFEIDSYLLYIEEACGRLRSHFCEQFMLKMMSGEGEQLLSSESFIWKQDGSCTSPDLVPSAPYQELYLELWKLQKHAEDNAIEVDCLANLLREFAEAIFVWISSKEQLQSIITEGHIINNDPCTFMQIVLDAQFLVEIARSGGYLSDNMTNAFLDIVHTVEPAFTSTGLNPERNSDADDGWAARAATKALRKLKEIVETKALPTEATTYHEEEEEETNEDPNMVGTSITTLETGNVKEADFDDKKDTELIDITQGIKEMHAVNETDEAEETLLIAAPDLEY